MTRAFLVLTRLRLLDVLRSRSSAGFVLFFPLVLLAVTALVFLDGHPFERRVLLVVAPPDDPTLDAVASALAGLEEVTVERARGEAEALGRLRARMAAAVLVPGAPDRLLPDRLLPDRLLVGPRDRLFGRGLAAALPAPADLVVADVPRGGYVHYLFPGVLVFSVMVAGLFATGHTMVLYRQNGFLKKLATTPLPRAAFVGAQVAARSALVLAQVALLVVTAWLFGAPFPPLGLAWLVVIVVLGLLTFMGLGFALACVIRTEDLVVDVISGLTFPLVLLSEIFFPLSALPGPLAAVGGWLPSTEMVRLARAVLLYGEASPAVLAPGLALLAACAAITFAGSLAAFRWHE